MKIKALAKLVKESLYLTIYNITDSQGVVTQWVSNGFAIYPLNGFPILSTEQLLRMMDIPEKDHGSYTANMENNDDIKSDMRIKFQEFWETESEDTALEDNDDLQINWMGEQYMFLFDRSTSEIYLFSTKILSPLSRADELPRFYIRDSMIAIKQGFCLIGLTAASSLKNQSGV